jgi:hypothetical protein
MGEHAVYDLLVAAILGAIAVLLAGAYAGLWVMRRRWLDTQKQLQQEREERLRAVNELHVIIGRELFGRKLAALDDGDDDDEPPEERRKRIRALPPLAVPIAALLAAGAWLRAHLWAPARAHPWTAAGSLAAAAAVATLVYVVVPGPGGIPQRAEPPISTVPTAPALPTGSSPPTTADPDRTPPAATSSGHPVTAGRRGSPAPSPSATTLPPPVMAGDTTPPPASSTPATAGGTAAGGTTGGDGTTGGTGSTGGATGGADGGTTGDTTTGGTTPPTDPDPPDEPGDNRDGLLCLDVDVAPLLRLGLCLL